MTDTDASQPLEDVVLDYDPEAAELADDLDLQFTCAGLAIGMGAAIIEGEEATGAMVDLMALWPDQVPESAGIIGYRVAMILAQVHDLTPEALGDISAHVLSNINKGEPT